MRNALQPLGVSKAPAQETPQPFAGLRKHIVNPRKLEHGFRMISAGIPYTLPLRP